MLQDTILKYFTRAPGAVASGYINLCDQTRILVQNDHTFAIDTPRRLVNLHSTDAEVGAAAACAVGFATVSDALALQDAAEWVQLLKGAVESSQTAAALRDRHQHQPQHQPHPNPPTARQPNRVLSVPTLGIASPQDLGLLSGASESEDDLLYTEPLPSFGGARGARRRRSSALSNPPLHPPHPPPPPPLAPQRAGPLPPANAW